VQVVAEFEQLLGADLVTKIEDALEIAAVGEMRRNGSYPAGDNLILAYSNPGIMRALTVGWIGMRRNNATFIDFANTQGEQLLELFQANGSNVLGEYNAPNYYGIDVFALAANIKYGPANSSMTRNAPTMLTGLWSDIAAHYNPYLGNLVGPYDRAYTRDMTEHSAIITMYWWGMFGHEVGPQPPLGEADLLYDIAQGAAITLIMDTVAAHIDDATKTALQAPKDTLWNGTRSLTRSIRKDLDTDEVRITTSWVSAPLMIGGQQVNETVNRGQQFVPAIVHWAADPAHKPFPMVAFFSLYPTASTVDAVAGPGSLRVAYPNTTQDGTDIFTFALSNLPFSWTLGRKHVIDGLEDLPCLAVNISAPGLTKLPVVYGTSVEDQIFYNVSYAVPADFVGEPAVEFSLEYTC
jgi:hypothetical protein